MKLNDRLPFRSEEYGNLWKKKSGDDAFDQLLKPEIAKTGTQTHTHTHFV